MSSRLITLSKWSMLFGNLFEHYDTALFSLLSPFLAPLFFPDKDPLTALILTYGIIPLGMIARPIGSLFFGYIGDIYSRKKALILSLLGMALITGAMGFLPLYHQVGIWAPILLAFSRIFQNFFAAGETMGGAIYIIENTSDSYKDLMSSVYNASTVAGILIASGAVSILCLSETILTYWRLLYLCGSITAYCAIFLRINLKHAEFQLTSSPASSISFLLKTCWYQRSALMTIAIASGFYYASYSLALVMLNGFIPLISSVSKEQMMHLNTLLLILDFILLPFFGLLSYRYDREKMMIFAGLAALFSGFPIFWLLQGASLLKIICIRSLLIAIGVWFSAPFHSWAQSLVHPSYRYTTLSFAYAIGSQLLGGPTAAISLWMFQKTGWVVSAAWYWMLLGLMASYAIFKQWALAKKQCISVF